MTYANDVYAHLLFNIGAQYKDIQAAKEMFSSSKALMLALSNPTINKLEKNSVIDKIFKKPLSSFIKELCENGRIENILEIINSYEALYLKNNNIGMASVKFAFPLNSDQINGIKAFLKAMSGKKDIALILCEDKALIGGCVVEFDGVTYDKSIKGNIENLKNSLLRR